MPRRWMAPCMFLVLATSVAYALTPTQDDKKPAGTPITCAMDAEGGAPYIFKNPKNPDEYIGYEVDIARALERELGRPIQIKQYEFSSIFNGLDRGDFDFSISGLEITPDRKAKYRFSRPYYIYKLQLVARKDEARFKSVSDCQRRDDITIGTLQDTAAERLLDKLKIKKKIYTGQVEPYLETSVGRIDGTLLDLPIAIYHGRDERLKFVGEPVEPGYYAAAFKRDNEKLASEVDAALESLLKKGELKKIYEKWKLWNDDQEDLTSDKVKNIQAVEAEELTFGNYVPDLLKAAWVTIEITLESMALAVALGLIIALGRLYGPKPISWLSLLYVEFFRGIPVLILLYFLYYGLPFVAAAIGPNINLNLNPMVAAVLGLGLNYAAYEAEIYRASIAALPVGQWEAAASLGMSGPLTFRRIILPQAIRTILPPMTNDFVALFKDTSIVSIIAVVELSKQYQILSKSSNKYLEIGLVTAVMYLVMSVPLGYLSRYLEHRWASQS